MSKILVSGGLVPTTKDTLLDARTRVATFSDIANIENPARFMVITVEDTGKKYEVKKLTSKIIGGIVVEKSTIDINDPEALVDLGLAEELRSEDEKVRQSNEKKRIEAENLRKTAEDSRKVNETNRVSAEGAREASERTRVSSEETRNANEQTRNSNETKRQSQESTRQSQESARQTNESARKTNESVRKEAESERKTEETSRRTAELSRSSAENTRAKNEQNRTTAENTRSSAEDRRVANETQRTANETARSNAELSREKAEGNRASTFETLKGRMQTTIQEGQTAVAATEKATSDAQKVVDNYDTKVAEQDGKLSELGSKEKTLENHVYGTIWDDSVKNGDVLFTYKDVNVGDIIIIESDKTYSAGGISFKDTEGVSIDSTDFTSNTYKKYTIPDNFGSAIAVWGAAFEHLKVTNTSGISNMVNILNKYRLADSVGVFSETISPYIGKTALQNIINEGDLIRISGESPITDNIQVVLSPDANTHSGYARQYIKANEWVKSANIARYIGEVSGGKATYLTIDIIRKQPLEHKDELLQALNIVEGAWHEVEAGEEGCYVNLNGNKLESPNYNISTEIELKKNDLLIVKAASPGVACIAKAESANYISEVNGSEEGLRYYHWKADSDCNVVISYHIALKAQYKIINLGILSDFESVKGKVEKLPEPKTILGKNLFNPADIIEGYYLSSGKGTLIIEKDSAVTDLIPVNPGGEYYIYRSNDIGTTATSCITADGLRVKPLYWIDGEYKEDTDFEAHSFRGVVKIPENAVYIQFTCKFVGKEWGYDSTQFEKGTEHTSYEPYKKRYEIGFENLPESLTGLPEKVNKLEKHDTAITINIANSDKIGFFSNSFLNGYCMLGKHAINNLSMFSDYIMYNYGHSGDDILELLNRVNSNEKWLGDVPVQDWGIKYGIIAMQDNDGALFAASSDTYYENAKKLANAIKALGGIPILSTEHDSSNYYYNFTRLASDYKIMFMNWGATALALFKSVFTPFWYNSHPATRTAWMWTYGMKPYIDSLPRPEKSIKLFRVRPSVNTSDIQNLVYEDLISRAELYEEITCGVSGLTEETEKYFDRIDTGNTKYATYKDEYQILQSKSGNVNFGNYALIEGILPYDKKDCKSIICKLVGSGITSLYIKKINNISNPLPSKRYVAFGITEGSLAKGQQFQITGGVFNDNILGTYTVEDVVNNVVVTTTSSSGKTTSGTDNPTTNISGVVLKGSYDYPSADYMKRYNKSLGEWVEVELNDEINLSSYIGTCMDFDKVSLLAKGDNISISDIEFVVVGTIKKENRSSNLVLPKNGISLLTNTTFNDSDTSWSNLSVLNKYQPVLNNSTGYTEPLPSGISTVRIMNKSQVIMQAIETASIQKSGYNTPQLQVKVVARYFPEYINSDTKWATSKIHRGSYDCANLNIKIAQSAEDNNPVKIGVIPVGIWWNEFIIDTFYFKGSHIIIESESDNIQIAKCELIQV